MGLVSRLIKRLRPAPSDVHSGRVSARVKVAKVGNTEEHLANQELCESNGNAFEADKAFETRAKRYTLWAGQRAGERCGEGG